MTIDELYTIIKDRQKTGEKDSYVASLFAQGQDRIIQKVGEEGVEVVIAAKNKSKPEIVSETADLWFHTLVMLSSLGITPDDILAELDKRHKAKK